jgi:twitching motility two-component system response regulator PilG
VDHAQALELLKQGVAFAKGGDKEAARTALRQSVALAPASEPAWLWLASLAESPSEALQSLERVLVLNPGHERARTAHRAARLQAAVALAKAGRKGTARTLLNAAVVDEPGSEAAWMWWASVAASPTEAAAALDKVLEINPTNERALAALLRLRPKPFRAPAPSPLPSAAEPPAPPVPPIAAAAAVPQAEAVEPEEAEPVELWSCPICEAAADEEQDSCPTCKAWLSLDDPEAFFKHDADAERMTAALRRLEKTNGRPDFERLRALGLARLNLRRFDAGVADLAAALRLRPEDPGLRIQVEGLARAAAFAPPPPPSLPQPRGEVRRNTVLVVDDSPTIRKLVTLTLERRGFQARAAADGTQAVAAIRDGGVPDLILLDITMPGVDGYELCRLLRQHSDTSRVPIVLLSGKDGFFSKVRGRWCGSTAYVTKPFEPDALMRVVERYCEPTPATASAPGPSNPNRSPPP